MHSSRMRTAHSLPYRGVSVQGSLCLGGLCPGGLCLGGLCLGVSVWQVSVWGVSVWGVFVWRVSISGVCVQGTEWQTWVKTLPCPKLRLRAVTRQQDLDHQKLKRFGWSTRWKLNYVGFFALIAKAELRFVISWLIIFDSHWVQLRRVHYFLLFVCNSIKISIQYF